MYPHSFPAGGSGWQMAQLNLLPVHPEGLVVLLDLDWLSGTLIFLVLSGAGPWAVGSEAFSEVPPVCLQSDFC